MDIISIHQLEVPTHIGITEEEQSSQQTLLISIELHTNTRKAGASDAIEDTIDYADVAQTIRRLGASCKRNTIEKFAEDIASAILETYASEKVNVTIVKHILPDAKGVGITIERP